MKMLDDLRRTHPGEPPRVLWRNIYRQAIEAYDSLDKLAKRAAEQELRDRVRWRRRARKRSQIRRKIHV
jgi:hypothetical protein